MTLTLTLKGRSNVVVLFFNLKRIVVMLIKTNYNTISQNILDQKKFKHEKTKTHIEPISCFCDLDLDIQAYFLNNSLVCNIFFKDISIYVPTE